MTSVVEWLTVDANRDALRLASLVVIAALATAVLMLPGLLRSLRTGRGMVLTRPRCSRCRAQLLPLHVEDRSARCPECGVACGQELGDQGVVWVARPRRRTLLRAAGIACLVGVVCALPFVARISVGLIGAVAALAAPPVKPAPAAFVPIIVPEPGAPGSDQLIVTPEVEPGGLVAVAVVPDPRAEGRTIEIREVLVDGEATLTNAPYLLPSTRSKVVEWTAPSRTGPIEVTVVWSASAPGKDEGAPASEFWESTRTVVVVPRDPVLPLATDWSAQPVHASTRDYGGGVVLVDDDGNGSVFVSTVSVREGAARLTGTMALVERDADGRKIETPIGFVRGTFANASWAGLGPKVERDARTITIRFRPPDPATWTGTNHAAVPATVPLAMPRTAAWFTRAFDASWGRPTDYVFRDHEPASAAGTPRSFHLDMDATLRANGLPARAP
jgi:hypothetical protein